MYRLLVLAGLALTACAPMTPTVPAPAAPSGAARPDPVLQATVERLAAGFGGDVGVYVRHLGTGASAELRADDTFPTASLVKVPLLLTLFDQVERGVLHLDSAQAYPADLNYPYTEGTDVVSHMAPGATLPLSEIAFLMVSVSDNHASLWLQSLVGTGTVVNQWLADHGFTATRVNSRTPGREDDRTRFGWGQTTPREMAELLTRIAERRAVSPAADEAMYRMLSKSYWGDEALSQIPPTVQVASKQGAVDRSRSEVLVVQSPAGPYVLCVITKNQTDERYTPDNEGYLLLRAMSRAVYQHFNPADPWRPSSE